jgi:DNA-binding transcriptional ArsR family regulator
MSIEALAFAKITDLGAAESPAARLLFYVIAENTFNDSLMCRVGQAELVYQTRGAMRTMQRHLSALVNAGIITVSRSGGVGAGRLPDAITIVGFGDWLAHERARHSRPPRVGPQHIERQHAKMASCQKAPKQASKPASTARAKPCANPVNREGGQSAILRGSTAAY